MKQFFILIAAALFMSITCYTQDMQSTRHLHIPANRHLSNLLGPTRVNVDLLPGNDSAINLGSDSKNWKNFYLSDNIYKEGERFLNADKSGNSFLGFSTGIVNTGLWNTAFGDSAMYSNSTASYNTATGFQALKSNKESWFNSAFGYMALANATEGTNSGFGSGALAFTTTGGFNAAFGGAALYNNIEGWNNTAHGGYALVQNTTGSGNTGVGQYALGNNITNSENTGIGDNAGGYSFGFSNATLLGAWTGTDSGLVNITAVGYGAYATSSNQVMIGNSDVTSIGGYANWSNFSDGRYKKNVKENVPGLEFIKQLRPVTYTLDVDGIESAKNIVQRKNSLNIFGQHQNISIPDIDLKKTGKQQAEELKSKQEKEKIVYTGFVAQEVEQAAKKLNYDFSGVDKPKTEKGFYALRYGDFIVPLVKAVQEQQKQIEEQQKQIDELKALIQSVTKQSNSNATNISSSTAYLKQNTPNPFNKSTVINYHIPGNGGNAQIIVSDMKGNLIKTFAVTKGEGRINISGGELAAGIYNYALLVNGKKVDTKQMVLTK
jgi:hypothetical protein